MEKGIVDIIKSHETEITDLKKKQSISDRMLLILAIGVSIILFVFFFQALY